ncbi:NAD(P)-dependent dehydrogenase (short-subunit alcohol dehydrogenase family) [Pullulanibacillus pueri]|uniref:Oxidoreductase n=1 Tax=Pullulanibacillus pueri TaxID=1437324 RepID=A0A8J2ZVC4_9BACL|nr:SDR family oxidoreductase [Pullulanibacillus pueri]MBM7680913.1 NAD(P)-dependent dehydrogenase (short-subunit alcohol dehydrogenase family) [Pullulanibacillus pueri]GGH81310.1 oxidoreductase [Pullulanibacillus pueri]
MRLEGKNAIITGAGSGIGKETALLFAQEGAHVTIVDINETGSQGTIEEIERAGGEATYIHCNVTDEKDVQAMTKQVIAERNHIDVLFNNAGISGVGQLHELDLETWLRVMNVNVNGVFLVSRAFLPQMMKQKSGSIINMSSCIAEMGLANRAVYASSKGAVLSLTKSMQVDYAPYNIRVNALMPGTIYTPFVEDYLSKDPDPEAAVAGIKKRQLSNELGKPIDVAYAALFLASDESKFMMGAPFMIDGGVVNGK